MHFTISRPLLLAVASAAGKTTTKASSSGGSEFLLVIILLFGLLYFFLIRPNQRRKMQAMRQGRTFGVGDEVVAGGMMGRVEHLGDDEVGIEVSDGVVISFVPQAVQLRSTYLANQQRRSGGLFGGGGASYGGAGSAGNRTRGASTASSNGGVFGKSGDDEDEGESFMSPEVPEGDEGAGETWGSQGPEGNVEASEAWPTTGDNEGDATDVGASSDRSSRPRGNAPGGAGQGA
jgi:preprotein translocase subunit YajC